MSTFSMFPQNSSSGPTPYIQFKAGRCHMERQGSSNSYTITPDAKKGSMSLVKLNDGCTHFQWTDRTNNRVVEDFIIFPGDAELSKVDTGRPGDRVYLLKWQGAGSRKLMFWMQDKLSHDDSENCRKFNEYMTNPPQSSTAVGTGSRQQNDLLRLLNRGTAPVATAADNSSIGGFDFSALLSGAMNRPPETPAVNTNTAESAPATGGALSAQDFQNAMMGMNTASAAPRQPPTSLQEVLRGDQVVNTGILNDPSVVSDLLPLLPEGQRTQEHLERTIRGPQFQQAVDELASAIEQDASGAVAANFGIPPAPGGVNPRDPVGSFLDAVAAHAPPSNNGDETKQEEKKQEEGDDKMDESTS